MTDFQLLNCPVSIISSVPGSTLTVGFHPPQFILHPSSLPWLTATLSIGIYAERGASQASHPPLHQGFLQRAGKLCLRNNTWDSLFGFIGFQLHATRNYPNLQVHVAEVIHLLIHI